MSMEPIFLTVRIEGGEAQALIGGLDGVGHVARADIGLGGEWEAIERATAAAVRLIRRLRANNGLHPVTDKPKPAA